MQHPNHGSVPIQVAWVVPGHSQFDDDLWALLAPISGGAGELEWVWPYDHLDHVGLFVVSGATIEPWQFGEGDAEWGFSVMVEDRNEFMRRLSLNIDEYEQRRSA